MDFWEATLMASSQDAVIQELLFRLASVYIDRLTGGESTSRRKSLKSADDLVHLLSFRLLVSLLTKCRFDWIPLCCESCI